jgi:molecular chaperone DnaJ
MQLKDYYKILELPPSAGLQQIKKSFRSLALKYHPDTNPENVYAAARFMEIQEAYTVLSDPQKREEYNYKRWYNRSIGEPFKTHIHTPATILADAERLYHFISGANVYHVDYDALSYHIRNLLNDTNIGILRQFNNRKENDQIVEKIMAAASPLPFHYLQPIIPLWLKIAEGNSETTQKIKTYQQQQQQKESWHKYKTGLVVLATLLLCWLIYTISK